MQTAIAIFTNTPPWVFALLALLIWQGCMALRPSAQPLLRMLIIPAVFFLMGLSRLVLGAKSIELQLVWVASAAVFAAAGTEQEDVHRFGQMWEPKASRSHESPAACKGISTGVLQRHHRQIG